MAIRSQMLTAVLLVGAAAAAAACGGKKASTLPDESGDSDTSSSSGSRDSSGEMVPPETMDEIQRAFERKRNTVSRCLSAAIDAKELPRQSRGKMTLNVTVMPGGKAGEVKVTKTSLESQMLADCVIGKVKEVIFPEVSKPYPTSYTYAFEAM
ncbi:MAG TPA: AgmX/PglI C-terminal domain-containing protein [Kofleriaceae bacterium]|nr:AgmX/PglI C-terminal domain-containing protein [Kofleriaceae bacterium]